MDSSSVSLYSSVDMSQAIASGDILTVIQMVNIDRMRLLDEQLVEQMERVQDTNEQIAQLNDVLAGLNAYAAQIDGSEADSKPDGWTNEDIETYEMPLNDAILAAGIEDLGFGSHTGQRSPGPGESPSEGYVGVLVTGPHIVTGSTTKGEIDAATTKVKGMIDSASNTQQMDMLRLQSLSNKRNETVESLTNFLKKFTDVNTDIIRNM